MLRSRLMFVALTVLGIAAVAASDFVRASASKNMVAIDEVRQPQQRMRHAHMSNVALAAAAGIVLGLGALGWRARTRRPAKRVAAHASSPTAVLAHDKSAYASLCRDLQEMWFRDHRMLAIVGIGERAARANVAARLAVGFAELGEKTLLADAGGAHAEAIRITPVAGVPNLYLLECPRERLTGVLTEAGRRFRVVLIDAPCEAQERHPLVALAGGALVVRPRELGDPAPLHDLQGELTRVPARVVGTVVNSE